ncbi:MAG: transcriptional repressor NrdR [Anaerofustis stercorihominis]|nr:transcriptional repressor NrdR [Anaerofustis stercorihominis]
MKCLKCNSLDSKVVDSRSADDGKSIRRRRECLVCGYRFTTYERIELGPLFVVKRDGSREKFDRDKIVHGIVRACEKRPVAMSRIEQVANEIEFELWEMSESEVETRIIGEKVMEKLRNLDDVAYVRFASVYKQFTDIDTFINELTNMLEGKRRDE